MKVSKAKKAETRRKLINQAVELFSMQGYDKTTMKQIARAAEVGDATIYKYFPTKEKVLLGYFDLRMEEAIALASSTADFEDFEFQEKLQLLVDSLLQLLLPDREFVAFCIEKFSQSPLFMLKDALQVQVVIRNTMLAYLNDAEEKGELSDVPFKDSIAGLFGEYIFGVIFYWIKDDSEEFSDTTHMVDLSLGIIALLLKSGLLNKVMEFAGFMLKAQLYRMMSNSGGLISLLQGAHRDLSRFKK